MKRLALISSILFSLLFASCMEDSDTREWREANEEFMKNIATETEVHPLEYRDSILTAKTGAKFEPVPATGIYYKVITEGTGARPVVGQTVKVNYTATFYNDVVFSTGYSSLDLDSESLIDGFYYTLQRMEVGSRWIVYIPYYLGYGSTTYYYSSPTIPAYSALVYDVELREIEE